MYINIIHAGKIFKGKVIYNFKQINDLVLLTFDMPLAGEEKDLMLFYRNEAWTDDGTVKEKYPEVFEQIRIRLKNVFDEAVRLINSKKQAFDL